MGRGVIRTALCRKLALHRLGFVRHAAFYEPQGGGEIGQVIAVRRSLPKKQRSSPNASHNTARRSS